MDALQRLEVWKKSCQLCIDLYQALADCPEWGFRQQITRAALSVPSNIAEGYERGGGKERIQFLRIAKGSCGELWTQLFIGREAGLLEATQGHRFEHRAREVAKMLHGLIRHYERALEAEASETGAQYPAPHN